MNAWPVCLQNKETVVFLNCRMTLVMWRSVLSWFECSWGFPLPLILMFEAWKLVVGLYRGRILLRSSLLAYMEGNEFMNALTVKSLPSRPWSMKLDILLHHGCLREFDDFLSFTIMLNWRVAFPPLPWYGLGHLGLPPWGCFKLNFDGSALGIPRNGGIGGCSSLCLTTN